MPTPPYPPDRPGNPDIPAELFASGDPIDELADHVLVTLAELERQLHQLAGELAELT